MTAYARRNRLSAGTTYLCTGRSGSGEPIDDRGCDQDGRQTVDERSGRCFQASERKRSTSFPKELDSQVILHAKHQVRKKLETTVDRKITTVEQLTEHVESIRLNIHAEEIYKNIKEEFESYIETENYKSILRVYNQKGCYHRAAYARSAVSVTKRVI